jgi:hypothetical protein
LSEGVASFEGGAEGYRKICRLPSVAELLKAPPSIGQLESAYHRVQAADVFAFTFVDFVISSRGWAALNGLIRQPSDLERLLGASRGEIEAEWHKFLKSRY